MTEDDPQRTSAGLVAGEAELSGDSELRVTADVEGTVYSQNAAGEWNFERAKHDLKAEAAAHKQQLEAEQARYQREEEAKDNALRRLIIRVTVWTILAAGVAAFAIGTLAGDADTRRWAQNVGTTILGGLVGAAAGYLTGRNGR